MLSVSRSSVQTARSVREADPELAARVESGEIRLNEAARTISRATKTEELNAASVRPLATGGTRRYPVIYADPPWAYEFAESESRAIENQYPTMPLDEIRALPVPQLATDDAVLFLWATSPKLVEALSVLAAWGFVYRTCAVWVKPQIGMGYYFRQQHELLLVGTRGATVTPAPGERVGSVFEAPRGRHSEKPAAVRDAVARMYPDLPRIELFARAATEGWAVWGNEAPS